MRPEERLAELLLQRNLKIAVAESCTGGLIGGAITSLAGSSAYFRGGVIAYDNGVKQEILKVPANELESFGAVSGPVVESMAKGVAKLLNCECAVSVSGIAGPGGATPDKPVGLVYVGFFLNGKTYHQKFNFDGTREAIRTQTVDSALEWAFKLLTIHSQP